jgi:HSP20 family molecular chaperone IbpA
MVDESSATAVENNGILTIKFDIVDSSNKEISIN